MVRRVVVDSSANLFVAGTQDIVSVPMKVRVGEREFPDDENLDVGELIEAFSDEAAESSTSCPNIAAPFVHGRARFFGNVRVRGRGRDRRSCPHE